MNRGAVAGVAADVRSGSLADIAAAVANVGFTPESGHHPKPSSCSLSAKSGHSQGLARGLLVAEFVVRYHRTASEKH
jgi:hypothetical protein